MKDIKYGPIAQIKMSKRQVPKFNLSMLEIEALKFWMQSINFRSNFSYAQCYIRVVWMACLSELPPLLYVVTLFLMIKKRIRFLPFIFDPATLYQNFACFTWFWKNWTSISGWLWILRLYWNWGNNHRNRGWFCFANWYSAAEAKVC